MKSQKGNVAILIILGALLVAGISGYFWWNSSSRFCGGRFNVSCSKGNTCQPTDPKNPGAGGSCTPDSLRLQAPTNFTTTISSQGIDTSNWKTYENSLYKFSFKYPSDWVSIENSDAINSNALIILKSPDTDSLIKNHQLDYGYSFNIEVTYYSNINNTYAKGGSWVGEWTYKNLADYFTDPVASKHKTAEITLDGKKSYEIQIGGAGENYGIMTELTPGILEVSFPRAWDKSKLGETEKQILSSFKFL